MKRLLLPECCGALYICSAEGTQAAQHEAAHALLAECLPLYAAERKLRLPVHAPETTGMGKPFFPDTPELHFNLSHCSGLAACLLSPSECGVDVERRRPLRNKVAKRVFSSDEQKALAESEDPDMLFTRLWTLKEAYVKAIGVGISYPMREVCFRVTETGIQSNRTDAEFWHTLEGEFAVSVCLLKACTSAAHSSP